MRNRIKQLLAHYGITQTEFAHKIGISKGMVSHVLSETGRGSTFKPDTIDRILSAFPLVNRAWLEDGVGDMISSKTTNIIDDLQTSLEFKDDYDIAADAPSDPVVDVKPTVQKSVETSQTVQSQTKQVSDSEGAYGFVSKHVSKKRDISKIVMFYKDGSFTEYYPNNEY